MVSSSFLNLLSIFCVRIDFNFEFFSGEPETDLKKLQSAKDKSKQQGKQNNAPVKVEQNAKQGKKDKKQAKGPNSPQPNKPANVSGKNKNKKKQNGRAKWKHTTIIFLYLLTYWSSLCPSPDQTHCIFE